MSTPRPDHRRVDHRWIPVPAVLAALTILSQITYPLFTGRALTAVTISVVVLFAAASLAHAANSAGVRTALTVLAVAAGCGLTSELIGVATGFPFGDYAYAGTLGPSIAGVPLIIGLAWVMMAWPAFLLGRRLAAGLRGPWRRVAVAAAGGVALASWDLFLDPQMTAAGHWAFADPSPGLPMVPGVPLTNYAGWLLVSVLIVAILDRAVATTDGASPAVPAALLGWTWLGSTLANAVFFDRPWVALYGFIGMGLVVGPYLWLLLRASRRADERDAARAATTLATR